VCTWLQSLGPYLGGEKSGLTLVVSSVISGVTASVTSLPFDMVSAGHPSFLASASFDLEGGALDS